MHFSCATLRCVTMRQDRISIFADVLHWMLRNWLTYSMILYWIYCKIQNMSQNTILSKSRFDASWRNTTHLIKKRIRLGRRLHCLLTFRRSSEDTEPGRLSSCLKWQNLPLVRSLEIYMQGYFSHIDLFLVHLDHFKSQSGTLTRFAVRCFFRWGWRSIQECQLWQLFDQDIVSTRHSVQSWSGNTMVKAHSATAYDFAIALYLHLKCLFRGKLTA